VGVVFGGGSVGMELVQSEWRRLNTGSPDDDEQAAKLWVRREMQWELSVVVTSTRMANSELLIAEGHTAQMNKSTNV
jgi:hypothetical protein